jgi:hypothetical protein
MSFNGFPVAYIAHFTMSQCALQSVKDFIRAAFCFNTQWQQLTIMKVILSITENLNFENPKNSSVYTWLLSVSFPYMGHR